jgi:hypothetical protein
VQGLTGSASNVLMVPNAALRFRATPEMMAQAGFAQGHRQGAGNSTSANGASATGSSTGAANSRGGFGGGAAGGFTGGQRAGGQASGGTRPSVGLLWYVDKTGKPAVARVRTGLTDGQNTQIIPRDSTAVTAGMQVIVGTNETATGSSSASNPLQPQSPRRGPGGF